MLCCANSNAAYSNVYTRKKNIEDIYTKIVGGYSDSDIRLEELTDFQMTKMFGFNWIKQDSKRIKTFFAIINAQNDKAEKEMLKTKAKQM